MTSTDRAVGSLFTSLLCSNRRVWEPQDGDARGTGENMWKLNRQGLENDCWQKWYEKRLLWRSQTEKQYHMEINEWENYYYKKVQMKTHNIQNKIIFRIFQWRFLNHATYKRNLKSKQYGFKYVPNLQQIPLGKKGWISIINVTDFVIHLILVNFPLRIKKSEKLWKAKNLSTSFPFSFYNICHICTIG